MALDYTTYVEAKEKFSFEERWGVFSGNKDSFNIAYECIDRHPKEETALRIKFDDGRSEIYSFADLQRLTSQFAHFLERRGIAEGDRVAVILNPSLEFYVTMFGIMKRGAVAVPCFPAFGPDAIEFRLQKSDAKMVVTYQEKASTMLNTSAYQMVMADELKGLLEVEDERFTPAHTAADTLAALQFSSGTTGTPKIVPYRHAAATLTAFIITDREPGEGLKNEIQAFIRTRLSRHEYPREIEFVEQLPETPDGKVKRGELRARERARKDQAPADSGTTGSWLS